MDKYQSLYTRLCAKEHFGYSEHWSYVPTASLEELFFSGLLSTRCICNANNRDGNHHFGCMHRNLGQLGTSSNCLRKTLVSFENGENNVYIETAHTLPSFSDGGDDIERCEIFLQANPKYYQYIPKVIESGHCHERWVELLKKFALNPVYDCAKNIIRRQRRCGLNQEVCEIGITMTGNGRTEVNMGFKGHSECDYVTMPPSFSIEDACAIAKMFGLKYCAYKHNNGARTFGTRFTSAESDWKGTYALIDDVQVRDLGLKWKCQTTDLLNNKI